MNEKRNKKQQIQIKDIPVSILLTAAFFLPVLILGTVFALTKIYPFGDRQLLVVDFWQQYYPFIVDLKNRLSEGSSMLWSWRIGAGGEYPGHIAFLLSSPFNLLLPLIPIAHLREVLSLFILIKIGLAGLFTAKFLSISTRRTGLLLPVFSTIYALCAWAVGYYSNLMWLDAFALAPLVILGVYSLYFNGKYKLYTLTLALAVFTNYLMGYFICAYVAITFFSLCIIHKPDMQDFFRKLARIAICSIIAIGMTAALTLPAYAALQNTYAVTDSFPSKMSFYKSFTDLLGNFIAFTPVTSRDGLPNLYSGMITLMLSAFFLRSGKVSIREKIIFAVLLVFLVVSSNHNTLTYIWHGFNFPNMLPARFSFLISFLLAVTAYRAYHLTDDLTNKDILFMALPCAFFITMAGFGAQEKSSVIASAVLCVLYLIIFALMINVRFKKSYKEHRIFHNLKHNMFHIALLVLIIAELSGSAYIGIKDIGNTSRDTYPPRNEDIIQMLASRDEQPGTFYRTEIIPRQTYNAPLLYGYDGLTVFSSSVDARTTEFMRGLGLPVWTEGGRYYFSETSPVASMFLNLRYLMSLNHNPADNGVFWETAVYHEKTMLMESNHYLPLGFMVHDDITGYSHDNSDNPFLLQNELFSRATGLDGDLFTFVDTKNRGHSNYDTTRKRLGEYSYTRDSGETEGYLKWNYIAPAGSMFYAYADVKWNNEIRVNIGSNQIHKIDNRRTYIFPVRYFDEDTQVSFFADLTAAYGDARLYTAVIDIDLFRQGYDILSRETMTVTEFSDTKISAAVTTDSGGLLYTSIPYDGRWRAFVDGEEAEILTLDDCMLMLRLTPGEHEITLYYRNSTATAGMIISLLSVTAFAMLIVFEKRSSGRKSDKHRT